METDYLRFLWPEVFSPFSQVKKLKATDGVANDEFGTSVAVYADRVLVGGRSNNDPVIGNFAGSAYIYEVCELLFCDSFESGDTTEWSSAVP